MSGLVSVAIAQTPEVNYGDFTTGSNYFAPPPSKGFLNNFSTVEKFGAMSVVVVGLIIWGKK